MTHTQSQMQLLLILISFIDQKLQGDRVLQTRESLFERLRALSTARFSGMDLLYARLQLGQVSQQRGVQGCLLRHECRQWKAGGCQRHGHRRLEGAGYGARHQARDRGRAPLLLIGVVEYLPQLGPRLLDL